MSPASPARNDRRSVVVFQLSSARQLLTGNALTADMRDRGVMRQEFAERRPSTL
jgi:hypothetical protein